jgi:hypothetical protein
MGMGSNHPSLFPMLRLWAIVLFCLFTYIHATATRGEESAEKVARGLSLVDRHGLLSLLSLNGRPTEGLLEARAELNAHAKKSAAQAQQAGC